MSVLLRLQVHNCVVVKPFSRLPLHCNLFSCLIKKIIIVQQYEEIFCVSFKHVISVTPFSLCYTLVTTASTVSAV